MLSEATGDGNGMLSETAVAASTAGRGAGTTTGAGGGDDLRFGRRECSRG